MTTPAHLWTALRWAAAGLHQIERVYADLDPYLNSRRWSGGGVLRVTPEMERPSAIFWSDVHFLMIAVRHLEFTLQRMGRGAPRLNRALSDRAVELRQLLEHWWEAEQGTKRWKRYRARHGPLVWPAQLTFGPGNPPLLTIGPDYLSINDLDADIRRVESELAAMEAQT